MTAEALPEIDQPHMVEAELVGLIVDIGAASPRSGQQGLGPSEIGDSCARALIHRLSGDVEQVGRDTWAAQVGTAVHAYLEAGIRVHPSNQGTPPRYLLEQRVVVGQAGGVDITGSADLFDIDSGTLCDWKCPGPTPMLGYQSKGPGPRYRIQSHLYGRGFALLGYRVNTVMIAFLPRVGELGSPKFRSGGTDWVNRGKRLFWSEPYDEQVAVAALARLNGLAELLKLVGKDALLNMYPKCDQFFCHWCTRRLW